MQAKIDKSPMFTWDLIKNYKLVTLQLKNVDDPISGFIVDFELNPSGKVIEWKFMDEGNLMRQASSEQSLKRRLTTTVLLEDVVEIISIKEATR